MRDMIWHDQEGMTGFKSEYAPEEVFLGPVNKRELPCDECPLFAECAISGAECSAFRVWCTKGDYKDEDVARLLREPTEEAA